jgi:hypothetical protein
MGVGQMSAGTLKGLRIGLSATSALSTFMQGAAEAGNMNAEAANEQIQAKQEYIQASQSSTEILRRYNEQSADQLAWAAESGISITSGSVLEARRSLQTDADRQTANIRETAQINAQLRRGRAKALRRGAALTMIGGVAGGIGTLGGGILDAREVG